MAQKVSKARKGMLARVLAAVALTGIYCLSLVGTSAVFLTATTTKADAQRGRGRGRGGWGRGRGYYRGGRGYYRGRGRGYYGGGCVFNPVYGRVICY
ncbi:hypothetical protein NML43_08535 [Rhodopseudomonas palustris]|jgi:hypothetical protein|uniref:hypothetical protein n=1 Tax=Rhodopseudomonas TaxID=1073 RepID=UPI0006B97833|nr:MULTISPECIES: hypothetical protein [Rhodopseudomonas]KPF91557.1 hypothetical protein IP86_25070 [Rhodopseudomonas sp. AAP120]MCP9627129.1 hypothetical protein [Rhodopseudomonas palustris]